MEAHLLQGFASTVIYPEASKRRAAEELTMSLADEIQHHSQMARELLHMRQQVLNAIPFGKELDKTRYDLGRIASPVVAVVGTSCAGKTSLINAICGKPEMLPTSGVPTTLVPVHLAGGETIQCLVGTAEGEQAGPTELDKIHELISQPTGPALYVVLELPAATAVPWRWLDTPGSNVEPQKESWSLQHPPALADVCLVVTPATQPMSIGDVQQLTWLDKLFPARTLILVISRCDQVPAAQRAQILEYIKRVRKDILPDHVLQFEWVSSTQGEGIDNLRQLIAHVVAEQQHSRLKYELATFDRLLKEVSGVLEWHEFAALRPQTLKAAQAQTQRQLQQSILELKQDLPRLAEEHGRKFTGLLPAKQRKLAQGFNEQLTRILNERVGQLGQQLSRSFAQHISQDLHDPKQLERLNQIAAIFRSSAPEYFDPKGALMGAAAGVGVVAMVGLALPIVGAALLGAALASSAVGGILGGFLGSGTTLSTPEQVREVIIRPAVINAQAALDDATTKAQEQIDSFCELLHQAVILLRKPENHNRDVKDMHTAIAAAHKHLKGLRQRFKAMRPPTTPDAAIASDAPAQ